MQQATLPRRLFRREYSNNASYASIGHLYGDRTWINDLDIVNELGGHSGCVNTLWWVTYSSPKL